MTKDGAKIAKAISLLRVAQTLHDAAEDVLNGVSVRGTGAKFADRMVKKASQLREMAYSLEDPVSRQLGEPFVLSSAGVLVLLGMLAPSPANDADATNRILCWDAGTSRVALVPWPDESGASNEYEYTGLAGWVWVRSADFATRKQIVFVEAMHLIVRDGCCPKAVHRALLGLREYRDGLAEDMPK